MVNRIIVCIFVATATLIPSEIFAQSQGEMNQEAAQNFSEADAELNKTYQKLVSKIDKKSQIKLKAAQKAWVVFRDAEAELYADFDARGGSMAAMIYNGRRAGLTKERTKQLQKILKNYTR